MQFNQKTIITALLLIACILSGLILAGTPSYTPDHITTNAKLDSLIQLSFDEFKIPTAQIRTYSQPVDSILTRKTYRVRVAPGFSKTSLHMDLHQRFYDYGFDTPAKVIFPEKDMNIYFTYKGTVVRTIRLITDDVEPVESNEMEE